MTLALPYVVTCLIANHTAIVEAQSRPFPNTANGLPARNMVHSSAPQTMKMNEKYIYACFFFSWINFFLRYYIITVNVRYLTNSVTINARGKQQVL